MVFHAQDIEPGGVYKGAGGQTREVISVDGQRILYRILEPGRKFRANHPTAGELRTGETYDFARWSRSEVA